MSLSEEILEDLCNSNRPAKKSNDFSIEFCEALSLTPQSPPEAIKEEHLTSLEKFVTPPTP